MDLAVDVDVNADADLDLQHVIPNIDTGTNTNNQFDAGVVSDNDSDNDSNDDGGSCLTQMKCEFPQGDNVCKRCKAGGHACVVEGRKPRSAPKSVLFLSLNIIFVLQIFYIHPFRTPSPLSSCVLSFAPSLSLSSLFRGVCPVHVFTWTPPSTSFTLIFIRSFSSL